MRTEARDAWSNQPWEPLHPAEMFDWSDVKTYAAKLNWSVRRTYEDGTVREYHHAEYAFIS